MKAPAGSSIKSNPRSFPAKLIANIAEITITNPIIPVVKRFLASSRAPLSPPEAIIDIAPVKKRKTNQMAAIIVINPIALVTNLLNIFGALFATSPSSPKAPLPRIPVEGANLKSASSFLIVLLGLMG